MSYALLSYRRTYPVTVKKLTVRHCSCSKYGLKCTELCGCGELCENAPVLEGTGHSVESDIEEVEEEDDLPSMSLD